MSQKLTIKAIIGLGNPGTKYYHTRHSIGFRVVDALAHAHGAVWQKKGERYVKLPLAPTISR